MYRLYHILQRVNLFELSDECINPNAPRDLSFQIDLQLEKLRARDINNIRLESKF